MIAKKASNKKSFKREWIYTNSAREAWSEIIEKYKILNPKGKILLPSYIGWSPNEGSGIFDSVKKSGLNWEFYELNSRLEINENDLKEKVTKNKDSLVLLVHYFGFVDPMYDEISDWLLSNEVFFVEDAAHAWLTDLVGGKCGRKGDFTFYSLHKLLPIDNGGSMVINKNKNELINQEKEKETYPFFNLKYDLFEIYNKRRRNYKYLANLLKDVSGINILHECLEDGICPQTLPIIIKDYNRDKLYQEMNNAGFGVVSLYHTMIEDLKFNQSEASKALSKKIMNLPVHQDADRKAIESMVLHLKKILNV